MSEYTLSYLGCVLDIHISGLAEKVLTKVNQKKKCFLARISKFLDRKAMVTLTGALVQP